MIKLYGRRIKVSALKADTNGFNAWKRSRIDTNGNVTMTKKPRKAKGARQKPSEWATFKV